MAVKFVEEFERLTDGQFPMLKLHSADYKFDQNSNTSTLEVKFIISAYELKLFTEDQKQKVESVVQKMFNGVETKVSFIRTFADEMVVKNKVLEFLNSRNAFILNSITAENLKIDVDENTIKIEFIFDTPIYLMLSNNQFLEPFKDFLNMNFNQEIEIILTEKKDMQVSEYTPRLIQTSDDIGLIKISGLSMVYGRRGIKTISEMPSYIANIKDPNQNCTVCGKVSEFIIKEYKNKKYDSNDPKSGPEMKKLVSFNISDTTGRIGCVAFPDEKDVVCFQLIKDGDEVIVKGKTQQDWKNPEILSVSIDAVARCKIDYSSIKYKTFKDLPLEYSCVSPEPYEDGPFSVATTLLEPQSMEVPTLLKDKTYVVFDLETTGVDPAKDEIIEIAACKMVNGLVTETFQTLVKPTEKRIPREVEELTHITNEMVQYCQPISKILPDFLLFCGDNVLVGHNIAGFDYLFIERYARALKYKFNNETIDTLIKAKELLPNRKVYKLTDISSDYGISHKDAHRALSDVLATAELLKILAVEMDKRK